VQTDELDHLVDRLREMGVSVTDIRDKPGARYAMAEGPFRKSQRVGVAHERPANQHVVNRLIPG